MDKQWLPIVGYEKTYAVSNLGQIMRTATAKNSKAGRILNLYNKRGYHQVVLTQNGFQKWHAVHKLVAEAFIEPKPPGLQINHKDGYKINNSPGNLEWVTCKENMRHRIDVLHKHTKGERNNHAILTEQQVKEIRALYAEGNHTQAQIAKIFGVSEAKQVKLKFLLKRVIFLE